MISIIKKTNPFYILSVIIGSLIMIPLLNILIRLTEPSTETWHHIRDVLLKEYIMNTIILVFGVILLSGFLGLFFAYVIFKYDFRSKKLLKWMFILPLAMPSYIAGYIYADMFSYTGSFTRFLKLFQLNYQMNVMHMMGAIIIFSLTLFPYVYLLSLSAFYKQSAVFEESALLLESSKIKRWMKVTFPLIRPAFVAGILLTVLETLNDYGLVYYFNIRVFSFAIFNAWFNLNDVTSAIRLSAYLMLFVLVIIIIEKMIRGKRSFQMHVKTKPIRVIRIGGLKSIFVQVFSWFILAISFFIPVLNLIWYLSLSFKKTLRIELLFATLNSITISIFSAFLVVILSIILANFNRMHPKKIKKIWLRTTNLGYAIPGAVIAVAVHLFFIGVDRTLYPLYRFFNPNSPVLILTLSLSMLLFAYAVRFMAIGFNAIESSYEKIGTKFTEASYVLKHNRLSTLWHVDLPLLKTGIMTALILVCVDVIKELPLTLILRPANYNTLATMVYVYASDEMLQESSLAALILIGISTVLIYIFTHAVKRGVYDVR